MQLKILCALIISEKNHVDCADSMTFCVKTRFFADPHSKALFYVLNMPLK